MTQKIIINNRYGGFGISDEAAEVLIDEYGWDVTGYDDDGGYADDSAELVDRSDSRLGDDYGFTATKSDPELRTNDDLVEVVERSDVSSSGKHASLKVVEIPDDVDFEIKEYDGSEWITETHRTWG